MTNDETILELCDRREDLQEEMRYLKNKRVELRERFFLLMMEIEDEIEIAKEEEKGNCSHHIHGVQYQSHHER